MSAQYYKLLVEVPMKSLIQNHQLWRQMTTKWSVEVSIPLQQSDQTGVITLSGPVAYDISSYYQQTRLNYAVVDSKSMKLVISKYPM